MSTDGAAQGAHQRAQAFLESEGVERLLSDVETFIDQQQENALPTGQETRVVSDTGGEKGSKLARMDLIPPDVMVVLAEHYGRGARKYADRNWEKGYDWSLSYAALQRHLADFWQGNDLDPDPSLLDEDGEVRSLHIVAALWHCVALTAFMLRDLGNDNRPKQ